MASVFHLVFSSFRHVTGVYPVQQIRLVANEKSAHIVSLVKRQKKIGPRNKFFSNTKLLPREKQVEAIFKTEELEESKMVLKKEVSDKLKGKPYPSFSNRLISAKTFLWMDDIPVINITVHTQIGEYIEVCPCWIYSPDKFYFHLRKFKRKFDNFTKDLNSFYITHEDIANVAVDKIKPQQPCAVFYKISSQAMWHRAEIVEINRSPDVTVNFIDYGTRAGISKKQIKYLHQNFQSFPRQALLGSLANIRPLKDCSKWSSESIRRFNALAFEKDLVAGVVNMDYKSGCIGMALSKTRGSEIHINDTLVKEGYAEFDVNVLHRDFGGVSNKANIKCKTALTPITDGSIHSPLLLFKSDNCNNMRLRKMFSFAKDK